MTEHVNEQPAVARLERSRSDRMLAGVCGGLARYFELTPVFFRVGFVVLTLLGGAGILVYLAAVLILPEEGAEDSMATEALRTRRERPWPVVGLALVAVAGAVLLSRVTLWPQGDLAWLLVLVAGALILAAERGVFKRWRVARSIAVVAVVVVVLLLAAAAAIATAFRVDVRDGIGERTYQPAGTGDVHERYRLGIGELRLDLAGLKLPAGETRVDARVGIGDLRITVPADVALRVRASAEIGEARVLGRSDDGRNASVAVDGSGRRVLVIRARVGLGNVEVRR